MRGYCISKRAIARKESLEHPNSRDFWVEQLFLQQQIDEVRRADEGDHDACCDAVGIRQLAADRIGKQQQPAAHQNGDGEEELMPRADHRFGDMRRHQADEGDAAGDGDRRSGQRDRGEQQDEPLLVQRHAEPDGDRLAKGEHIQAVGLVQRERDQDDQPGEKRPDERPVRSPYVPREPFGDKVDLGAFRRRDQDDHNPGERHGEADAGQDEPNRLQALLSLVREEIDAASGKQRARERDQREHVYERAGIHRKE